MRGGAGDARQSLGGRSDGCEDQQRCKQQRAQSHGEGPGSNPDFAAFTDAKLCVAFSRRKKA
jgi:hypothetical protein